MVQAARKVTAKDPGEKLAHRRLTVLELAERLGNVSEACRRGGIDRTSFYDWKRRFQLEGLDGLKDLPPIAKKRLLRLRLSARQSTRSSTCRLRPCSPTMAASSAAPSGTRTSSTWR